MKLHELSEHEQKIIAELENFGKAIRLYDSESVADLESLRSHINQNIDKIREYVIKAGCHMVLDIGPPPAIGGMIFRNVDPFISFFDPPYGANITSAVSDMIDRTIGKIKSEGFNITTTKLKSSKGHPSNTNKVFVVHGHDNSTKEIVARFLERLGLEAIILHEQPSKGMTVIEKVEHYTDVSFAVVLLTPDDLGIDRNGLNNNLNNLKPRARQNVIFELGYLTSRLGRDKVCALIKGNVEKPSDYDGVIYITKDVGDSWKFSLAKEIKAAGIAVDLNKI